MKYLTLKAKIWLVLGLFTIALAANTAIQLNQQWVALTQYDDFSTKRLALQDEARLMQLTFKKQVQAWKDILIRGTNESELRKHQDEFLDLDGQIQEQAGVVRRMTPDPAIQAKVDLFLASHAQLTREYQQALVGFRLSHGRNLRFADAQVKGKDRPITDAIDQVVTSITANTRRFQQARRQEAVRRILWTASFAALFTLALLLTGTFIVRSISSATRQLISRLSAQASAMREGKADLTITFCGSQDSSELDRGEFGEIASAFDTFTMATRDILSRMAKHSERLAQASEELSSGAGQSAESSRQQSDQTQQIATAMHEMSATIQQISENSEQAAKASQSAAQAARKGGEVATQTLASMHGIADATQAAATRITELGRSSEHIGKIIAVIDDIADQTNLLALNAAIEAARAGQQGRGFAVVADEVRKLAERTTGATKEIATMIKSIQAETLSAVQAMERGSREVQAGVENTSASGAALGEIIHLSEQVGDMITQIATAATQQSSASEEINGNLRQISGSTQQASAVAGTMAKACQDLAGLALDLQQTVSGFELGSDAALAPLSPVLPVSNARAATAGR